MLMTEVIEGSPQRDSFQLMLTRCRYIPSYWTLTAWATALWHFVLNRQVRTAMLKGLYFMDGATLLTPIYDIKILELTNDLSPYIFLGKNRHTGGHWRTDETVDGLQQQHQDSKIKKQNQFVTATDIKTDGGLCTEAGSFWPQNPTHLPPAPPSLFLSQEHKIEDKNFLFTSISLACLPSCQTNPNPNPKLTHLFRGASASTSKSFQWRIYFVGEVGRVRDGSCVVQLLMASLYLSWSDYLLTSFITLQDRRLFWPYLFIDNVVTFYCENYTFYWKT